MKMLAVYDICHPRRLNRVAKILKDYGIRVQYSKFEIDPAGRTEFESLQLRIDEEIEPTVDGVKFIPLCRKCRGKIEIFGQGKHIGPNREYYIF